MKKDTVTVSMEAEKLRAIKRYMGKKEVDMEAELAESLQRLYEKYVPVNVREYIEEGVEEAPTASGSAKKQKEKRKEQPRISNSEIILSRMEGDASYEKRP